MSPELETLDQLIGAPMPLPMIRRLYPDFRAFASGILAMLRCGDVQLLDDSGEVPHWRWTQILARDDDGRLAQFRLDLTPRGASKIS